MRLVATEYLTLDGVFEEPGNWSLPFLMFHPIVLGKGRRLFADGADQRTMAYSGSKTFDTGIVVLEYGPAKK